MSRPLLTRCSTLCKCLCLTSLVGLSLGAAAPGAAQLARHDGSRLAVPGSDEPSLRDIDQQLLQRPTDLRLRFQRGLLLAAIGREGEALEVFQRLVRDQPTLAPAFNNIGSLQAALGDYDAAKAAFEMATRIDPENTTAYQNLGDLHLQLAVVSYERLARLGSSSSSLAMKLDRMRELQRPGLPAGNDTRLAASPAAASPAAGRTNPLVLPSPPGPATPVLAERPAAARMVPVAMGPGPSVNTQAAGGPAAAGDEVASSVQAWAQAWSRRDVAAYLAHYEPGFSGRVGSHPVWKKQRTRRILQRSHIEVGLAELEVRIDGDRARAAFLQSYDSDGPKEVNRKVLTLARGDAGEWLIIDERAATGADPTAPAGTQRATIGPNRPTAAASLSSARDRLARASTH